MVRLVTACYCVVTRLSHYMPFPMLTGPATRMTACTSTCAYVIFLGSNAVLWCSHKQHSVSRSSTKAEYRAIALTASKVVWLSSLLHEMLIPSSTPPTIYYDNIGSTYLCSKISVSKRPTILRGRVEDNSV